MPGLDLDEQIRPQTFRLEDKADAARCKRYPGDLRLFFESFFRLDNYPSKEKVDSYIVDTSSRFNVLMKEVKAEPSRETFAAAFNAAISDFDYTSSRRVVLTGAYTTASRETENDLTYLPHLAVYGQEDKYSPVQDPGSTEFESFDFDWGRCIVPIMLGGELIWTGDDTHTEMGLIARKIFIEQPYRWFVPVVLLGDSDAVLYVFHRSGMHIMNPVNMHRNRLVFLHLFLCLAFPHEDLQIGIPPTVYYDDDAMFLEHYDTETDDTFLYQMVKDRPIYIIKSIESRGSCCWQVHDVTDSSQRYIIKLAWRQAARNSETKFLEAAKGLPGVSQMVWSTDRMAKISDFPGVPSGPSDELQAARNDRILSITALWDLGTHLSKYTSHLQLLRCFYDAISGHRNLLHQKRIMHRDVSMGNILLGHADSPEGYRGVLIDFDLAAWVRKRLPRVTSSVSLYVQLTGH
ncbi:hypothetical protein CPC08DRAFT_517612 [Agrocybe pediades]|nr:hypothetical protein CPC08DRAFT_517612 [Agrocybe pediades]